MYVHIQSQNMRIYLIVITCTLSHDFNRDTHNSPVGYPKVRINDNLILTIVTSQVILCEKTEMWETLYAQNEEYPYTSSHHDFMIIK